MVHNPPRHYHPSQSKNFRPPVRNFPDFSNNRPEVSISYNSSSIAPPVNYTASSLSQTGQVHNAAQRPNAPWNISLGTHHMVSQISPPIVIPHNMTSQSNHYFLPNSTSHSSGQSVGYQNNPVNNIFVAPYNKNNSAQPQLKLQSNYSYYHPKETHQQSFGVPSNYPPPLAAGVFNRPPVVIQQTASLSSYPKFFDSQKSQQSSVNISNSSKGPKKWPPSLRRFTEKCFAACSSDSDRNKMETILQSKITESIKLGTFETKDWDQEQIPLIQAVKISKIEDVQPLTFCDTKLNKNHSKMTELSNKKVSAILGNNSFDKRSNKECESSELGKVTSRNFSENENVYLKTLGRNFESDPKLKIRKVEQKLPNLIFNGKEKNSHKDKINDNPQNEILLQRSQRFDIKNTISEEEISTDREARRTALLAMAADGIEWDENVIIGTCQRLDKRYLRLTSAPDPKTVRSLPILKTSLSWLLACWVNKKIIPPETFNENSDILIDKGPKTTTTVLHNQILNNEKLKIKKKRDMISPQSYSGDSEVKKSSVELYGYICEQFKSIRQDLTVQQIQSSFTVKVYESHARIALEMGDLGEYNQCQGQLKNLYLSDKLTDHAKNEPEFVAYRILYLLLTDDRLEMALLMLSLKDEFLLNDCVSNALNLRNAVIRKDYASFFAHYKSVPNLGKFIVDHFLIRERQLTLRTVCRAYRPSVPLEFIQKTLVFSSESELKTFLLESNLAEPLLLNDKKSLDCKAALSCLSG